MTERRPPPGTPEFDEWFLERAKKRAKEIYNVKIPEELAEKVGSGLIAGPKHLDELSPERTASEDLKIDKEIARSHLKKVK